MPSTGSLCSTSSLHYVVHMTSAPNIFSTTGRVPDLNTLAVRCQVSRETAGMSQTELAEAMDASRSTVSNLERGLGNPRRVTLRLWAMATGVDPHWLETGEAPSPGGDGASADECAIRDSNPEPADLESVEVRDAA